MATILVVEDSPTEAYLIGEMLGRHGHRTVVAKDGEESLALARSERPDLILMDIVLPGLNGFQATRRLAKDPDTAHIPIIVVTSKAQATDRVWALRQGAREYIVKPVEEAALMQAVRHHLEGTAAPP